jgi:hypothetical protein
MEKQNDLENWKNEVLGSLEGMQRAVPESGLLSEIKGRLKPETYSIQWPFLAAAAAGVLILLMVNFLAIREFRNDQLPSSNYTNQTEYSIYTSLNLYNE